MNRLSRLFAIASLLLAAHASAAPADEAQRIQKSWDLTVEKWKLESNAATTPDARAKALANRPDLAPFARQMWDVIGPALAEEWTLAPAAWFLRATRDLVSTNPDGSSTPTFAKETEAVQKSIETQHLKSPDLIPTCMALVATGGPRSLSILDKIQETNPDKKIQGVAALASSMILKTLGDNADITRKRLTDLRKAIIQSSDVDLGGGFTVAKIAEDELYIIRFLSKGRTAPDLSGMDSAGRPLKLSDFKDKVVLLMFWSSENPQTDRVIQITADMVKKFQGKPFLVLGVNHDPLEKLRSLEADGTVTWRNFSDPANKLAAEYRVGSWPMVFVLDGARKIQYAGIQGSFAEITADALLSETKPDAAN